MPGRRQGGGNLVKEVNMIVWRDPNEGNWRVSPHKNSQESSQESS